MKQHGCRRSTARRYARNLLRKVELHRVHKSLLELQRKDYAKPYTVWAWFDVPRKPYQRDR